MESLEEILHVAYEAGASDIHLTVGIPPTMRLNGHLVKMDYPILRPEDTLELCLDVLNPVQRENSRNAGNTTFQLHLPELAVIVSTYSSSVVRSRLHSVLSLMKSRILKSWEFRNQS